MRTLLIDSDVVAYQHSAAGERAYDWEGDGVKARVADPIEDCIERCREWMTRIKSELKADALVVCLSDPARNFRKDVLPTYKSNRAGTVKPEHLFPIKAWLQQEYRSFIRPTLEADDIMGILATHPKLIPGEKVIVSIDKDMGQIPGKWFNPKSGKMKRVTVEEGERLHYLQMLTGDPVDGYKGLPGCGPVKAAAILDEWYGPVPREVYKAECAWTAWCVHTKRRASPPTTLSCRRASRRFSSTPTTTSQGRSRSCGHRRSDAPPAAPFARLDGRL
jgi:DNA polymerase-1